MDAIWSFDLEMVDEERETWILRCIFLDCLHAFKLERDTVFVRVCEPYCADFGGVVLWRIGSVEMFASIWATHRNEDELHVLRIFNQPSRRIPHPTNLKYDSITPLLQLHARFAREVPGHVVWREVKRFFCTYARQLFCC